MITKHMPQWANLQCVTDPWAQLIVCSEREADSVADAYPFDAVAVRIIRGRRCTTKTSLLAEWAAALQFPYYFGDNWDAFDECMCDLALPPFRAHVLILTQSDKLLQLPPDELGILCDVLRGAAPIIMQPDNGQARIFRLLLQCNEDGDVGRVSDMVLKRLIQ